VIGFFDQEDLKSIYTKGVQFYPAFVRRVDDPLGLHRVRVEIPGFIALSSWAFPVTMGGGSEVRGGHVVPAVDSLVFVVLLYGDEERPIYFGGSWALEQAPHDIRVAGTKAHLIQSLEFGKLGTMAFRATINETPGQRLVRLYVADTSDPNDEQVLASLEFDLEKRGITLFGLSGVSIKGTGFVDIDSPQLTLNDRLVISKAGPL